MQVSAVGINLGHRKLNRNRSSFSKQNLMKNFHIRASMSMHTSERKLCVCMYVCTLFGPFRQKCSYVYFIQLKLN